MTRTRNTSIVGTTPPESDVDAKTFQRVILEAVQDFNLCYDRVTGQNGIGSSITTAHTGELGRGSLLGVPIINAYCGRSLALEDASTKSTYGEDVYVYAFTAFMPQGETVYTLDFELPSDTEEVNLEVLQVDGTNYFGGLLASDYLVDSQGRAVHRWLLQFTGSGNDLLFLIRRNIEVEGSSLTIRNVRMYARRLNAQTPTLAVVSSSQNPFPVPAPASGLPSDDATGVEIIHDEMCVAQYALPGRVVTTLSRNINALWEYVRASAVPGNDEVTNADTGAVNPTTSRHLAHTRSEFASEPLVEWPLFSEGLGCCRVEDGGFCVNSAGTDGILDWHAPYPVDVNASTGHIWRGFVPDFPASPSQLTVRVLCVNDSGKGTPTDWEIQITTGAGSTGWVALTQVPGTFLYTALFSATAGATSVPFTPDAVNEFQLQTRRSGGSFLIGEMAVIGWGAAFTVLR